MVGKVITTLREKQHGDEFDFKLGRKQIQLVPVGGSDVEE